MCYENLKKYDRENVVKIDEFFIDKINIVKYKSSLQNIQKDIYIIRYIVNLNIFF